MQGRILASQIEEAAERADSASQKSEIFFRVWFLCMVILVLLPGSGLEPFLVIGAIISLSLGIKFSRDSRQYAEQLEVAEAARREERRGRLRQRIVLIAEPAPEWTGEGEGVRGVPMQQAPLPPVHPSGKSVEDDEVRHDGDAVYGRAQYGGGGDGDGQLVSGLDPAPDYAVVCEEEETQGEGTGDGETEVVVIAREEAEGLGRHADHKESHREVGITHETSASVDGDAVAVRVAGRAVAREEVEEKRGAH